MALQTHPGLLYFTFAPPSASEELHIHKFPSTQFHYLAYLLVTREILSNTVILEMGFQNQKLQLKLQKF